ncbi:QueT transporter family protein [Lactobacillus sp. DCY120]|uniref:QueT transporter family protein n=1 Tax=Bombilactobacillus apium TaxID=2675299 RepID=A0A850R179_9LACO|nr:QueT transporter family protein [Bombilactobacillus apium]NVY96849.1 QueT transporter family protein [Bombilactobacillus apium]
MKAYWEEFTLRDWILNALIAAIYVVLTVTPPLNALAYGNIQLRISEALVMLPFYNHKLVPGMTVGCFITNLFSPTAAVDIFVGTFASLLVFLIIIHLQQGYLVPVVAAIINGLIIGAELHFMSQAPFWLTAAYIFIGELIAVIIGYILFRILFQNRQIKRFLL